MYKMIKCVKCNCEKIKQGDLSGPSTLALEGIPDWLSVYLTFTCEKCGYTEIVKKKTNLPLR